jgi:hypothetical protein
MIPLLALGIPIAFGDQKADLENPLILIRVKKLD